MDSLSKARADADLAQSHSPDNLSHHQQYASADQATLSQNSPLLSAMHGARFIHANSPLSRDTGPGTPQTSSRDPRATLMARPGSMSAVSMSPPVSGLSQDHPSERPASEPRPIPSREINDATIDDAYARFIIYCNPSIPTATDTTELKKMFRTPPRSEGKSFSTYTLWELIQKLDRKELKTWIQLAIELGVEPPSLEKRQSTQKVQQYAVRLKRWMRAMHIDAFFEFCLGRQHPYFTKAYSLSEQEEECRDGVLREEDLALTALVPEWKPKRGRKRADEANLDIGKPKKARMTTPNSANEAGFMATNTPDAMCHSAVPWTAFPDDEHTETWPSGHPDSQDHDPKLPGAMATPEKSLNGQRNPRLSFLDRTAPFPYPHSAVTPRHHNIDAFFPNPNEPLSAITPSSAEKANYKRRGRPNISSAWLGHNSVSRKARGRPILNTTEGVLLPPAEFVHPSEVPATSQADATPTQAPSNGGYHAASNQISMASRPTKLHLQVPKSTSGSTVRLATPPMLLVNGQNGNGPHVGETMQQGAPQQENGRNEITTPYSLTLDRVASAVSQVIQTATLIGRSTPLRFSECNTIAESMLQQVSSQCHPNGSPATVASYCAFALGVGHKLGLACNPPESIIITMDTVIPSVETNPSARLSTPQPEYSTSFTLSYKFTSAPGRQAQISIQAEIPSNFGLSGDVSIQQNKQRKQKEQSSTISLEDGLSDDDFVDSEAVAIDWKQKFLNLRQQTRKKESALRKYKKQILEAVMTDC
ncbi:hypothetical protein FQN57_003328 [Myotisia sp. PD_48]|nr:hypothetical protein FQN57_003328 [Myotisia sp. PD_48]